MHRDLFFSVHSSLLLVFFASALLLLGSPGRAQPEPVVLQPAFPRLTFTQPLFITQAPDNSGRLFVAQQNGVIKVFPRANDPTPAQVSTFLDISSRVLNSGEQGLLGLAFDPNYATNGKFYVHYSWNITNPSTTRLSRFTNDNPADNSVAATTEESLFELRQPYSNHNGGWIGFGPDQMLYFALGDGGSQGDPENRAQNKASFFGKILRLDVTGTPDTGLKYRIPPDNPFYNDTTSGVKKEIWAYGFRNPWRCSFDTQGGTLYCGDVGGGVREEVDTVTKGGNYGWRLMEGTQPHNLPPGTDTSSLIPPITDYPHSQGNYSITGGYAYHGARIPSLEGLYVYGDYGSGRIWALKWNGSAVTSGPHVLIQPSLIGLSSFGQDSTGEIYVCDLDGGGIYTLWPQTVSVELDWMIVE